ncbi:unnamed protein product [Ambrosiozyma monospora]|uniref:Unnamed protein product n=1 Tax=Ambrosiozyma monospora TaxID=43982 RepID=A0A9W6YQS3_AMBMO|nr:unnamed protein product [Ambrosiozyma monospora]
MGKPSRRSRKKRRTEDFSSDSSSDEAPSANENEDTIMTEDVPASTTTTSSDPKDPTTQTIKADTTIDINTTVHPTIDDLQIKQADLDTTKLDLDSVLKLDKTISKELDKKQQDLNSLNSKINGNRNELLTLYLKKMLGTYGDDLNTLRQSNDFNQNGQMSLTLLAGLLKQSGNVFSDEVLSSVVED